MRNMSFFLTTPQFIDGSKDVTRRIGWWNLKAGDHFMAVVKSQGLKQGEQIQRLGECEVVSVRIEPLFMIHPTDLAREGFPHFTNITQFTAMFCKHMKCDPFEDVNRIEFKRVGRPQ